MRMWTTTLSVQHRIVIAATIVSVRHYFMQSTHHPNQACSLTTATIVSVTILTTIDRECIITVETINRKQAQWNVVVVVRFIERTWLGVAKTRRAPCLWSSRLGSPTPLAPKPRDRVSYTHAEELRMRTILMKPRALVHADRGIILRL